MSQVTVRKADKTNSSTQALLDSLESISSSIRDRAFELSQSGGGDSVRNWLQAERDLFCVPNSLLSEEAQQYRLQVAVPGLETGDLEVIALGNSVIVRSLGSTQSSGSSSHALFNDLDTRTLFRRFDLAGSIDIGSVSATLDNGMLTVTARKAASKSSAAGA